MFSLKISTANEAFDHCEAECSRILREIADKLDALDGRAHTIEGRCRDINGNTVGKWTLKT